MLTFFLINRGEFLDRFIFLNKKNFFFVHKMSITERQINGSSSSEDYSITNEPNDNDLIELEIDLDIIKTRQINGNQSNQPSNDIFNWLIKNQTSSQYIFFL